jgi:alpha-L-arabinofuranosidase
MGAQQFSWLQGTVFDTYTLKVKARKLDTLMNAYIIPFAVRDSNTMLRAHIGSWLNTHATFEAVTNGYDVSDLISQVTLPARIEAGRWYDITLEVGLDTVNCYLDGQLLMRYTEPQKFFSIAGRDNKTGDVIIKVVNGYSEPYKTTLRLNGMQVAGTAQLFTLTAPSLEAENSMKAPKSYVPKQTMLTDVRKDYEIKLEPYSISVLRIKNKQAKPVAHR